MKKTLMTFVIGISCTEASIAVEKSPQQLLKESLNLFDKDECNKAINLIKNLKFRTELNSLEEMIQALKIRSICYWQIKEEDKSKEAIRELFYLEPKFQFDPFDTPKSMVDFAKKERELLLEKSGLIFDAKKKIAQKNELKAINYNHSLAFLPFGLNHLLAEKPVKGYFYLSLQTAALITNISSFWLKQSYLTDYGMSRLKNPLMAGSFESAQTIQFAGLLALVLGYGVSLIDAWLSY